METDPPSSSRDLDDAGMEILDVGLFLARAWFPNRPPLKPLRFELARETLGSVASSCCLATRADRGQPRFGGGFAFDASSSVAV